MSGGAVPGPLQAAGSASDAAGVIGVGRGIGLWLFLLWTTVALGIYMKISMYAGRKRGSDFRLCMCDMCSVILVWFGISSSSHSDGQDTGGILSFGTASSMAHCTCIHCITYVHVHDD